MQQSFRTAVIVTGLLIWIALGTTACSHREQEKSILDYVPRYNENATPDLPPPNSVSYGIWGWSDGIPAKPIGTAPQFIEHPAPEYLPVDEALLAEAGCTESSSVYEFTCDDNGPLQDYDCNWYENPFGVGAGLDPAYPIVAECWNAPLHEEDPDNVYMHRGGCLGFIDTSYIIKVDGDFVLVNTPEKMKELFAPIDSPEEALSYALMLTGMYAIYDFPYEPDYIVYFLEVIEATHVTETKSGYIVHLYHSEECGCDTFLTSQVDVIVNSDGSIEWGVALPAYLKVAEGMCVD